MMDPDKLDALFIGLILTAVCALVALFAVMGHWYWGLF